MKDCYENTQEDFEKYVEANPILKFFEFKHLPEKLQDVSLNFWGLAHNMGAGLKDGPEKTEALRKLLEAKDCAVRAALG